MFKFLQQLKNKFLDRFFINHTCIEFHLDNNEYARFRKALEENNIRYVTEFDVFNNWAKEMALDTFFKDQKVGIKFYFFRRTDALLAGLLK